MTGKCHIITVYAEPAAGPGWANAPIWVIKKDLETGKIFEDSIQPDEQTKEMILLYPISAYCHDRLTRAVEEMEGKKRKVKK